MGAFLLQKPQTARTPLLNCPVPCYNYLKYAANLRRCGVPPRPGPAGQPGVKQGLILSGECGDAPGGGCMAYGGPDFGFVKDTALPFRPGNALRGV